MNFEDITTYDYRRVKERSVGDVMQRVQQWRNLFTKGVTDEKGHTIHLSLQEAANMVGIPKKTLEDYEQVFKKVSSITNIALFSDKKMGFLRKFIKKNKSKIRRVKVEDKDRELLRKNLVMNQILNSISERPTSKP